MLFSKIPPNKVFYMKETATPSITGQDNNNNEVTLTPYAENTTIYMVKLDGDGTPRITTRDMTKNSSDYTTEEKFTVPVYKVSDVYRIMNTSTNTRKVILKKADVAEMGGSITSGALEMSNVDLAAEMTDLIVDQRGFQANSKVITTSDEMLQTLRDLKR